MFDVIKSVLGEINTRLNEINVDLNEKMNQTNVTCSTNYHKPTNKNVIYQKKNENGAPAGNCNAKKLQTSTITNCNQIQYCGPYKLEKTLGKGQTGLVKTGTHCITGRKVAVKIVNKEKLNDSVLQKVEREIAIMKLIEHPHVLHLYDVYENKKYLYLLLEHVSGGELFDYLVRKGRLMSKEARKFFRQIISALDFCHAHNICHRDLKPENLLLDERNNIKVADFGMASLQVEGSMLETSCGSPHYACPEVIRGEKYDGRKADVWSCGVILYALLVGALPFDDDNLRNLLEKVKKGLFHIPHFVPANCQNLLRAMIEVDPNRRISLQDVFRHSWVAGSNKSEPELELPMSQVVETHVIPSEENIDPDVFRHMNNLGCFKDREKLINDLLSTKHNTEKIVYFLLLDRKRRRPARDDDTEIVFRSNIMHLGQNLIIPDPPRKRTDISKPRMTIGSISEGSPINPRKTYGRQLRNRHSLLDDLQNKSPHSSLKSLHSSQNEPMSNLNLESSLNTLTERETSHYYTQPIDSTFLTSVAQKAQNAQKDKTTLLPQNYAKKPTKATIYPNEQPLFTNNVTDSIVSSTTSSSNSLASSDIAGNSSPSSNSFAPWRNRISSTIRNSFLGTPRFHRRKFSGGNNSVNSRTNSIGESVSSSVSGVESDSEESLILDTTDLVKKSWFGSLTAGMGAERDDIQCVPVENKTLNEIKAELIRSFLTIHELSHSVIGENSFKVEYKRGSSSIGSSVFLRGVKMQVDIVTTDQSGSLDKPFFVVNFTLHTGPVRRFRRLVDHLASILQTTPHRLQSESVPKDNKINTTKFQELLTTPRRLSDSNVTKNCKNASDVNKNNLINTNASSKSKLQEESQSSNAGFSLVAGVDNSSKNLQNNNLKCFLIEKLACKLSENDCASSNISQLNSPKNDFENPFLVSVNNKNHKLHHLGYDNEAYDKETCLSLSSNAIKNELPSSALIKQNLSTKTFSFKTNNKPQ